MKLRCLLLALGSLAVAGCATSPTPTAAVVDREGFVARLPEGIFVAPPWASGQSQARFQAGLTSLGPISADLVQLPDGARAAKLKPLRSSPHLREVLRTNDGRGFADFLVLVNTVGQVEAIYCYDRSHPVFEKSATATLKDARFTPAAVNGVNVPIVLVMPMTFQWSGESRRWGPVVHDLPTQVGPVTGPLPRGI